MFGKCTYEEKYVIYILMIAANESFPDLPFGKLGATKLASPGTCIVNAKRNFWPTAITINALVSIFHQLNQRVFV